MDEWDTEVMLGGSSVVLYAVWWIWAGWVEHRRHIAMCKRELAHHRRQQKGLPHG